MSIMRQDRPWLKPIAARPTTPGDVLNVISAAFEDCGWEVEEVEADGSGLVAGVGFGHSLRIRMDLSGFPGEEVVPHDDPSWGRDVAERDVGYGLRVAEGEVWEITPVMPPELDGIDDDGGEEEGYPYGID